MSRKNDNQFGFPGGFLPFPFSLVAQQQPVVQRDPNVVPARVQFAASILNQLTEKSSPLVVRSGGMFDTSATTEVVDGQKLDKCEMMVQEAACDLLSRYFKGSFEPNPHEAVSQQRPAGEICCPSCRGEGGQRTAQCNMCCGVGSMLLVRKE